MAQAKLSELSMAEAFVAKLSELSEEEAWKKLPREVKGDIRFKLSNMAPSAALVLFSKDPEESVYALLKGIRAPETDEGQLAMKAKLSGVEVSKGSDISMEVARKLTEPFDDIPITLADLKLCLGRNFNCKLPLRPSAWEAVKKIKCHEPNFVLEGAEAFAELISSTAHLCLLSTQSIYFGNVSENSCQLLWDFMFTTMWGVLCDEAGDKAFIDVKRNHVDLSGATSNLKRPDLMLLCYGKVIMKSEEKPLATPSMQTAIDQLKKNTEVLDPSLYCDMKYVLGVATADNTCRFFALHKADGASGVQCHSLTRLLRLSILSDRVMCLVASINILRLACSWAQHFEHTQIAPSILSPLTHLYGPSNNIQRTIRFLKTGVQKIIFPWDEHVKAHFSKEEYVCRAYRALGWQEPTVKHNSFKLKMRDRGSSYFPETAVQLRDAVRCILEMLDKLHRVELVHRDVQWANVLWVNDDKWILIDYETVWIPDCQGLCKLKVWDAAMQVNFSKASDLKLCGMLLEHQNVKQLLDNVFNQFQQDLLSGNYADAGAALATFRTFVWEDDTA